MDFAGEVDLVAEQFGGLGDQTAVGAGLHRALVERALHVAFATVVSSETFSSSSRSFSAPSKVRDKRDGGGRPGLHGKADQPRRAALAARMGDGGLESEPGLDVDRIECPAEGMATTALCFSRRRRRCACTADSKRFPRQHLHRACETGAVRPGRALAGAGQRLMLQGFRPQRRSGL